MKAGGIRLTQYESTPVYANDVEIGRMADWRWFSLSGLLETFHRVDVVEKTWKLSVADCKNYATHAKEMSKALDEALKPLWSPAPGVKHKLSDNDRRELVNQWVEQVADGVLPTVPEKLRGLVPATSKR